MNVETRGRVGCVGLGPDAMLEVVADKDLRDRLEALQVELRELEARQLATVARLEEAKALVAAAIAREREAALARPQRREGPAWSQLGRNVVRWGVVTALVVAVFGAVLGTVTFAIHRYYRAQIAWRAE
jgi:hypothetical protein